MIADETWADAKRALERTFAASRHLSMVQRLLQVFEEQSGKRRFVSDWRVFLRESREEDFLQTDSAAVFVATMHKAKGREFDHVVLALGHFKLTDEASRRVLYVAMTRARESLTIHAGYELAETLLFRERRGTGGTNAGGNSAGGNSAGGNHAGRMNAGSGYANGSETGQLKGFVAQADRWMYAAPNRLLVQLFYKDVHLGTSPRCSRIFGI